MDKCITGYSKKQLASLISYVPQFSPHDIHFSVEEYVSTGRYPHQSALRGVSAKDKETVERAMEITSIKNMRDRDISTLSGGERQRVMIAAALAQETEILLLDEPTIYLDPKSSMDVLELLAKIHADGTTVIMVTHDINQALMFGTGFIGIKEGKIIFNETSSEMLADSGKLDELFDMCFCRIKSDGTPQILPYRSGK
jgi:iron complex transport system ATP-binding protein